MSLAVHRQPSQTGGSGSVGLSDAVLALGGPNFGAKLFGCFRQSITIDMYSAFTFSDGAVVQLAFAGGTCSGQDQFAMTASERYADTFWRADPLLRGLLSSDRDSKRAENSALEINPKRRVQGLLLRTARRHRPHVNLSAA